MQLYSPTIAQAVHQLQILPPVSQQTALDFINFLVIQNQENPSQNLKQTTTQTQEKPKRQFGQMMGRGSFKIKDDFEIKLI